MPRPLLRFLSARARVAAGTALACLLVQQAPGCVPDDDACERSRTCRPSGGAPMIVETWGGASGEHSTSLGGGAGEGGIGGQGGAGPSIPGMEPGHECTPNGSYACVGFASRDQLVCVGGRFASYGTCPEDQRCDTRPDTKGLCQPLVPECDGQLPGDLVCRETKPLICGADLVTAEELETCPGGCVAGKCTECSPNTPSTCEFNSRRACTAEGTWEVTSCAAETPQCIDGKCVVPPSCQNLDDTCGLGEDEPCCSSPLVPGGTFDRNNDPTTPATVSPFRLDRFEVTVGRFRAFKEAWDGGWRPDGGAGKHVHVHGGLGLSGPSNPEVHESGWQDNSVASVTVTDASLTGANGPSPFATWTLDAGETESKPINFVFPQEAAAFCIWDGGFLPTDAEWSFAATGGDEQRAFPWGDNAPAIDFELAIYGCHFPSAGTCTGHENVAPVGTAQGVGLFEQLDLAGNMGEWTFGTGTGLCVDCGATLFGGGAASLRKCGGDFDDPSSGLLNEGGCVAANGVRDSRIGVRCARVP